MTVERPDNLPLDRPELAGVQADDGVHRSVVGGFKKLGHLLPTVFEDYVNRRIQLHARFRVLFVGQEHAANFCAVYERDPASEFPQIEPASEMQLGESLAQRDEAHDRDDSVLIHVPQIVEFPQWVGRRVVSVVRLQIPDCLADSGRASTDHRPFPAPKFVSVNENWKLGFSQWPTRMPDSQLFDQMVESGSHVVDDITSHDAPEDGGRFLQYAQAKDVLSCFRFVLDGNLIGVSTVDPPGKLRDCLIEELEMETRPLHLHPNSIEGLVRLRSEHDQA